ncbi:MAG: hypothetical protein ABI629_10410 [bacterium]
MPPRTSKTGITVADLKASELYGILGKAVGEALPLANETIEQKLFAAEDFYEHELGLRWTPTRVLSNPEDRANVSDPLLRVADFDPIQDISEPAYDYPRGLWEYERCGFLQLRNRPIRSIIQVVFTWGTSIQIWRVPLDWVQPDRRAGTINMVPTSGVTSLLPFNVYLMSVLSSPSRGLPHSILIDYTVGFSADELAWHHQDLLNGVRLMTLLNLGGIVSTIASGGQMSGSLSMDGLSHSRGFGGKYGAYSGPIMLAIEQEKAVRDSWRAKQRGIQMAIC